MFINFFNYLKIHIFIFFLYYIIFFLINEYYNLILSTNYIFNNYNYYLITLLNLYCYKLRLIQKKNNSYNIFLLQIYFLLFLFLLYQFISLPIFLFLFLPSLIIKLKQINIKENEIFYMVFTLIIWFILYISYKIQLNIYIIIIIYLFFLFFI